MTLKRTSNNNYSDFAYTSEVKKLLNVTLNKRDENKLKKTNHLIEKLEILNPLSSLKRGYAIIKKDDKCITSLKTIKKDDIINVTLKDGIAEAKVMEVKNG